MATIQIRDVPDEVHRRLKARAAANGVSLSDYLRAEMASLVKRPTVAEWLEARPKIKSPPSTEEVVAAIREGREERERQLTDRILEGRRDE